MEIVVQIHRAFEETRLAKIYPSDDLPRPRRKTVPTLMPVVVLVVLVLLVAVLLVVTFL